MGEVQVRHLVDETTKELRAKVNDTTLRLTASVDEMD